MKYRVIRFKEMYPSPNQYFAIGDLASKETVRYVGGKVKQYSKLSTRRSTR